MYIARDVEIKLVLSGAIAKFAKSDYWRRHVCLSVRVEQLFSHSTDFHY